jgi:hypothetical protein
VLEAQIANIEAGLASTTMNEQAEILKLKQSQRSDSFGTFASH